MQRKIMVISVSLAVAVSLAGCGSGDPSAQLKTNEQFREQVMAGIARSPDLAIAMQQKLLASDSLRAKVVDTVLGDGPSAQYVLYRIATNEKAMDMVLTGAASDSVMRKYVATVVKGWGMVSAGH